MENFVDLLGGKCQKCGYNCCLAALDFHHIDEKDKGVNLAKIIKGSDIKLILKEVKKCKLFCANCHREHHYKNMVGNVGLEPTMNAM